MGLKYPQNPVSLLAQNSKNTYLVGLYPEAGNGQEITLRFDDFLMYLLSQGSELVTTVYNGLSAQGATSSTTSILEYGINVFTTVNSPNGFATKLPQPITGRAVIVINKGLAPLYVFPSNIGGQIANNPIDAPFIVPPNGEPYTFYCIVNPLPGQWSVVGSGGGVLQINPPNEIVVNHVTGVQTQLWGWVDFNTGAFGATYVNGLLLSPPSDGTGVISDYFVTGYTPTNPTRWATAIKWQTNFTLKAVNTDPFMNANASTVELEYGICGQNGATSVFTSTSLGFVKFTELFLNPLGYSALSLDVNSALASVTFNPGGPAYADNIGDLGSIDAYLPFNTPVLFGRVPGTFLNNYFICKIRIPSGRPTGTYKFMPYFEYY
jgi:hypothetical protein